jgi:hypothetical protein
LKKRLLKNTIDSWKNTAASPAAIPVITAKTVNVV